MPRQRHAKGPRLWLQPARVREDGSLERSVWCILDDGGIKRSTGWGPESRAEAEGKLGEYLGKKRLEARPRDRSSSAVQIADVIAIYSTDVAPKHARPKETAARLARLLDFWGSKTLSDVTGATCREYAEQRGTAAAGRRDLEDLRAAIIYHRNEGLCREVVDVVLPEKAEPRSEWLTRGQVARLMLGAWKYREVQKGHPTDRRTRRHVAKFMVIARYTGTRAGAICKSSFQKIDGYGWIDLDRGVWYRRPANERETKKRRPPIPLPGPLLAFMRRWHAKGQRFPVEFNRRPISDCDKAFSKVATDAKIKATPHTFRHTAATWMMQNGGDKWESAGYLGMTEETLNKVYGHHHPDHMGSALRAISPRKNPERIGVNKTEQTAPNVIKIADKSKAG